MVMAYGEDGLISWIFVLQVQAVLLLLGGCEVPSGIANATFDRVFMRQQEIVIFF